MEVKHKPLRTSWQIEKPRGLDQTVKTTKVPSKTSNVEPTLSCRK